MAFFCVTNRLFPFIHSGKKEKYKSDYQQNKKDTEAHSHFEDAANYAART